MGWISSPIYCHLGRASSHDFSSFGSAVLHPAASEGFCHLEKRNSQWRRKSQDRNVRSCIDIGIRAPGIDEEKVQERRPGGQIPRTWHSLRPGRFYPNSAFTAKGIRAHDKGTSAVLEMYLDLKFSSLLHLSFQLDWGRSQSGCSVTGHHWAVSWEYE